jgi:hypothetical protein
MRALLQGPSAIDALQGQSAKVRAPRSKILGITKTTPKIIAFVCTVVSLMIS